MLYMDLLLFQCHVWWKSCICYFFNAIYSGKVMYLCLEKVRPIYTVFTYLLIEYDAEDSHKGNFQNGVQVYCRFQSRKRYKVGFKMDRKFFIFLSNQENRPDLGWGNFSPFFFLWIYPKMPFVLFQILLFPLQTTLKMSRRIKKSWSGPREVWPTIWLFSRSA